MYGITHYSLIPVRWNRLFFIGLIFFQKFLLLDEISDHQQSGPDRPPANQCRIVINDVHAKWDKVIQQLIVCAVKHELASL